MTRISSAIRAVLLVASTCVLAVPTALAGQTIAYPSTAHALFTVTAPDDWKLTQATEAGGFFNLNGPTGALVSFRCVPGTVDDIQEAIDNTLQFVNDSYDDVKVSDPTDATVDGQPGFFMNGSGVNTQDGGATKFVMAWFVLKNGNIVEIWAAVDDEDQEGGRQAATIVKSFKGR